MTYASTQQLKAIQSTNDIPEELNNTPFQKLLEYHNLGQPDREYDVAQMAIVMCMDNRKQLNIPSNFAYILRTAGARITGTDFKLSLAIGFGGIKYVALIAHTHCGMVDVKSKRARVIQGLIDNAGWTRERAEDHFDQHAPFFEIENEVDFVVNESKRLSEKYPKISFLPMLYKLEDNLLYLPDPEINSV